MSNADEILKLKELLDEEIITKEEFEKKKNELLNTNTKQKNINISNNKVKEKKQISVGKIVLIIFAFLIGLGIIITITTPKVTIESRLKDIYGLSEEQSQNVMNILTSCGINSGIITANTDYDNVYVENSKGYNIRITSKDCTILLILKDNEVYSLKMLEIDNQPVEEEKYLYNEGAKVALLSDYVIIQNDTSNKSPVNSTPTEKFTLVSDQGSYNLGFTTITGEIKNNTNKTYSYVQVTFSLYDASGAQVGTAMDNINNFEANGSWHFSAIGSGNNATSYKCTGITGW